jgi:hypothetical protein
LARRRVTAREIGSPAPPPLVAELGRNPPAIGSMRGPFSLALTS